jgi:hypothetical protein
VEQVKQSKLKLEVGLPINGGPENSFAGSSALTLTVQGSLLKDTSHPSFV